VSQNFEPICETERERKKNREIDQKTRDLRVLFKSFSFGRIDPEKRELEEREREERREGE